MTTAESHRHDDLVTKADLHALDERIDRRFDMAEHRFDLIDQRFEQVDQRFERVDQRFEQVDQRFNDLNSSLQGSIQVVGARVESLSTYLNRVVLALFALLGVSLVTLLVRVVD